MAQYSTGRVLGGHIFRKNRKGFHAAISYQKSAISRHVAAVGN
jgi:hypothetical protein